LYIFGSTWLFLRALFFYHGVFSAYIYWCGPINIIFVLIKYVAVADRFTTTTTTKATTPHQPGVSVISDRLV